MPDEETESMTEREPQAFTPASAPRREDELPLAPLEKEPDVPLEEMPNIRPDVAGGVSESEVTDQHQSATPTRHNDTGQTEHPPASTAP